ANEDVRVAEHVGQGIPLRIELRHQLTLLHDERLRTVGTGALFRRRTTDSERAADEQAKGDEPASHRELSWESRKGRGRMRSTARARPTVGRANGRTSRARRRTMGRTAPKTRSSPTIGDG